MKFAYAFVLLLTLVSCGQQDFNSKLSDTRQSSQSATTYTCPCSDQVNLVCGANGQTYTNSCYANCNNQNYTMGACVTNDCTKSGVVCGRPNTDCNVGDYCEGDDNPTPKNYDNDCARIEAKATLLHLGSCTADDV